MHESKLEMFLKFWAFRGTLGPYTVKRFSFSLRKFSNELSAAFSSLHGTSWKTSNPFSGRFYRMKGKTTTYIKSPYNNYNLILNSFIVGTRYSRKTEGLFISDKQQNDYS
jgi:hypothetical protein